MTKQEHIEEMISAMAASNNPFVDVPIEIMPKVAEALYNAGYRKLLKGSVVLSREEICELKYQSEEDFSKAYDLGSKETAEKILKDFKLWAREHQNKDTVIDDYGERPMTNNEKLNYLYTYLCDKYKVEIKE